MNPPKVMINNITNELFFFQKNIYTDLYNLSFEYFRLKPILNFHQQHIFLFIFRKKILKFI